MDTQGASPIAPPDLHPLLGRLLERCGAPALDVDSFDAWSSAPGHALLVFTEDPLLYRETLDLAVIVPELLQAFPDRFRTGVLLPAAARAFAPRFGFRRWPALVLLKDGRYVGAIDGLRDWNDYINVLGRLLAAAPSRPPSIGIAVKAEQSLDSPARCQ